MIENCNRVKLTVVYYEYPAAEHNIISWERKMDNKIVFKDIIKHRNSSGYIYIIDKFISSLEISEMLDQSRFELVLCITLDNISETLNIFKRYVSAASIYYFSRFFEQVDFVYNKLLLFGKFDEKRNLKEIEKAINEMKLYIIAIRDAGHVIVK